MKNNPSEIISGIDDYGRTTNFLMNVGSVKGKLVTDLIAEKKPRLMVELGGYVGYSAILFGDAVRRNGGEKYISLEESSKFAAVARELISLAGLDEFVEVVIGPCSSTLPIIQQRYQGRPLEFLFIDHKKDDYVVDLVRCEILGMIAPGTHVIADNCVSPGAPLYLEYVRGDRHKKSEILELIEAEVGQSIEPSSLWFEYESTALEGAEPTGEPVSESKCATRLTTY